MACRSRERAQAACDQIKLETKNDKIYIEDLDLGDLESVKNFAKVFNAKCKHLDVLINNAGMILRVI